MPFIWYTIERFVIQEPLVVGAHGGIEFVDIMANKGALPDD